MIGTRSEAEEAGTAERSRRGARRGRPSHGAVRDRVDRADWVVAEVLHELYADAVLGYVVQRVARREEAERITTEVFAAAAAGLPRFRGECAPYVWLLEIARRKIAEARGRRRSFAAEAP